jgi:hypothetical protein
MGEPVSKIAHLLRCCGPAGNESERNDAYLIDDVAYLSVGLHRGSHQVWECLENIETGERKDLCNFQFKAALETGEIKIVPAMEVLARISK